MKAIKIILVVLVIVIAVPLIAALFVDNEFEIERSIVIERPKDEVFDYLRHLRNHEEWAVWGARDPDIRQEYHGTDGAVGALHTWQGNEEVGRGEQEIVRIVEGERIDVEVRFFEPFESKADGYLITQALDEDRTRVIWGFESRMPYPMNLMLLVFNFEDELGKDYEQGLQNMKAVLESQPEYHETETEVDDHGS